MKKHDLQIDGQINLFDLLESVENTPSDINPKMDTSWDDMTEDELFEEIIKECDLKKYKVEEEEFPFDIDEKDIRIIKKLKFKINQTEFEIGPFDNFDIINHNRFVHCDCWTAKENRGASCPAESIPEIIDFINHRDKLGQRGLPKELPPIIKELSKRLQKLFENQETYKEEYEVWEHVPSLGKRYSIFVKRIEDVPREELDEIEREFKKYNLEVKDSFAGWDAENKIKIAISTMWTTKGHKENLEELKVTLPLKKTFCSVIGADCGMHTYKGCQIPEQCEHMKAAVADRQEIETLKEDIETIEEKVRSWIGEDFLPYIVAQIIKNKSWLLENIRQIEYKDLEDYGKPLRDLFTEHVYKFMVADTEFELTKAPYDTTIYFIQCQEIKNEHGYVLTLANILSKEIVLELMKQPRPVHIKGICDDAYCPECGYALDELKELDCEKCPICGTLIDWTPWHRQNDKEPEKEKKKKIQVNRALPILECHPRTIETYRQVCNLSEWQKKEIENQYNNNPYDLNELAKVCKKTLGVGGRSTNYGVVDYNESGWSYRFKKEWEGVYVEQLSWREYARNTVELIVEDLWNNFPAKQEGRKNEKVNS